MKEYIKCGFGVSLGVIAGYVVVYTAAKLLTTNISMEMKDKDAE